MKNRKGISTVIATVLIILITVSAAAILYSSIMSFVKSGTESTSCVPYREYLKFDTSMEYNCYDSNSRLGFSIKALAANSDQQEITNFSVKFIGDGVTKTVKVGAGAPTSSGSGGVRMIDSSIAKIVVPASGETQTYVFNTGGENYSRVEVYPVLLNGRLCDRSDAIDLEFCLRTSLGS